MRRARVVLSAALLCAVASCGGRTAGRRPWPAGRSGSYVNPIPAENARPGDPRWADGVGSHAVEAYTDRVSARAGDAVGVQVRSDAARPARWALYRFGWYGGAGARKVAEGDAGTVSPQAACPPEAGTGLVRCTWPAAFVTYTTDAEVALRGAGHLLRAGAFVSVGHDEYWSGANRDAVEAARDAGMPLVFLGANSAYWKVRYDAPGRAGSRAPSSATR